MVIPIDPGTGDSPHILAASAALSQYGLSVAWSPTGRDLAYAVLSETDEERFYVASPGDWKPRALVMPDSVSHALAHRSFVQTFRWDPTGRALFVQNRNVLVRADAKAAPARIVARSPLNLTMLSVIGPAVQSTVHLSGDGDLLVATRNDSSKKQGIARVNTRTGSWTRLWEAERFIGSENALPMDVGAVPIERCSCQSHRLSPPMFGPPATIGPRFTG